MRPGDRRLARQLRTRLISFSRSRRRLPGIRSRVSREVFLEQLVESIRRVRFVSGLRTRPISSRRADPDDNLFDPLRAAILHQDSGNIEEAFWLVFLFVHFGKNSRGGWRYAREVYGQLCDGSRWDWPSVSSNVAGFRSWLHAHEADLKRPGVPGGFGNHRKYQTLDAYSSNGTGAAVETYVNWVGPPRGHQTLVGQAHAIAGFNAQATFEGLYQSMRSIASFGRTARFDYLTMLGKLGLAPIEPGSAYLQGSTGPFQGARLLFGSNASGVILDHWLVELDADLSVGMQVLEDALCNWQKSPRSFIPFRG